MTWAWDNQQVRTGAALTAPSMVATWIGGHDVADSTCSVKGCERASWGRGWCQMHHARVRRYGTTDLLVRPLTCTVEDCGRTRHGHGLCEAHYNRLRIHGSPVAHVPVSRTHDVAKSEDERFWEKVDASGDCWEWISTRNRGGYGQFHTVTRGSPTNRTPAHRWAWETLVGLIPEGLVLDHLCRNPPCVNPDHLEPVTDQENIRRGVGTSAINARKDRCDRGHEFTGTQNRGRWRRCVECDRERAVA